MISFFKAEWKTIAAAVLFCGTIYGWFYIDALRKADQGQSVYALTCIKPGESVQSYKLGSSASLFDLSGCSVTSDTLLGTERYLCSDGVLGLTFRSGILSAIEYYPTKGETSACTEDIAVFKKRNRAVAESIRAADEIDEIYEGLVIVQRIKEETEVTAESSGAPQTEGTLQREDIGAIVVSR